MKKIMKHVVVTFKPIHDFDHIEDKAVREAKKTELMISECSGVIHEERTRRDTSAIMDRAFFWIAVVVFFCLLTFLSQGL
jgi:hypothetical protein